MTESREYLTIEREGSICREEISLAAINIKAPSKKDYITAYVKALFYDNTKWIRYLEKDHINQQDQVKFRKLTSSKTHQSRQNYFNKRSGKLNSYIRNFIDKYNRFETHRELYAKKKGSDLENSRKQGVDR